MSRVRRLVVVLRETALWLAAGVGTICVLAVLMSAVLGVRPVVFQSGSMSPAIETGALAFARTTPADELRVGDVVMVSAGDGAKVAHRVKVIEHLDGQARVRLQGDANPAPDPEPYVIDAAEVVLFDLPHVGRVVSLAGTPAGLLVLGTYSVLLLRLVLRRRRGGSGGGAAGPSHQARHRAAHSRATRLGTRGRRVAAIGTIVMMVWAGAAAADPWSDQVAVAGVNLTADHLHAPSIGCSGGGLLSSPTVSWPAPAGPAPSAYVVTYTNGGSVQTETTTSRSWRLPSSFLGLLTTYEIWVASVLGNWTSLASNEVRIQTTSVLFLGVVASCA